MMLGLRDEFEYIECAQCSSLQISSIPADLSRYYPDNYYSYVGYQESILRRWLQKHRGNFAWTRRGIIGLLTSRIWGESPIAKWLTPTGIKLSDSILDVGCGSGKLLMRLHDIGFTQLTGIDPFIRQNVTIAPGVHIYKKHLHELSGSYDLVMFHHSLEHTAPPDQTLRGAANLIKTGQYILIRTPVAGCFALRTYGSNWVQLDPPRHLAIPSEKGMEVLAERMGLKLVKTIYESSAFQFWASEQYKKDIPLMDDRSYNRNPNKSPFHQKDIDAYEMLAKELNAKKDGDQACFYLRKL